MGFASDKKQNKNTDSDSFVLLCWQLAKQILYLKMSNAASNLQYNSLLHLGYS